MRLAVFLVLVLSPLLSSAQQKDLPDVLKPDQELVSMGERDGYEVAKILPRGMYEGPFNAYKDEENPLGIREGGSYFSFTTRNHSYNKIPQIGLEKGVIRVGFYGLSYGFMTALGDVPLDSVGIDTFPAKYLADYDPPYLYDEIRAEQRRSHLFTYEKFKFHSSLKAEQERTYLVRAISFDEADKLVAFRILKIDDDGSMTIGWRSLKDFAIPRYSRDTDDVLREKVAAVVRSDRYRGVEFTVAKGVITVRGFELTRANQLKTDLQNLRPRGVVLSHQPID
jgi:hypothetical protein